MDSRDKRDGEVLEYLGSYDPKTKPAKVQLKEEQIYLWLRKGAMPSDTVRSMLKRTGYWKKFLAICKGQDVSGVAAVARPERKGRTKKRREAKAEYPTSAGPAAATAAPAAEKKEEAKA